jgi:hypothetical protein
MKDLTTISSDLFNKIRSRFSEIKIGDEQGALTNDPEQARFFDVNFKAADKDLGRVNIKIDEKAITIIYNNAMTEGQAESVKNEWFAFLKDMRQFARKNMLSFDTRDITKSNLEKRDYQYLAKKSGEPKMSESKLFGTSKTSYQDMGEAQIIVKHSQPVNYNVPAGRTQHIEAIYIESSNGERFRYPHRHLNGARAMARHVANGGTAYDSVGQYISGLSEELGKLRQFKNYTQRSGVMAEALGDITERVAERIEGIKSEIVGLQKQGYYEQFKETFEPGESQIVPEDIMNTWVDALTIKTFNEELKTVFPYIYKLVGEKREGQLTYDDLVAEAGGTGALEKICPTCEKAPCECDSDIEEHSLFSEFETQMDEVSALDYEKTDEGAMSEIALELAQVADDEDYDKLYALLSDPGPVGRYLQGKIEDITGETGMHPKDDFEQIEPMLMDIVQKEFGGQNNDEGIQHEDQSGSISQEVVEFIQSMYDSQTGTFPRGEEGVKIAVEKKFGEQAGQFANFVVEKLSAKSQSAVQEQPAVEQQLQQVAADPAQTELLRIRSLAGF